jgi:hypothetical protein
VVLKFAFEFIYPIGWTIQGFIEDSDLQNGLSVLMMMTVTLCRMRNLISGGDSPILPTIT